MLRGMSVILLMIGILLSGSVPSLVSQSPIQNDLPPMLWFEPNLGQSDAPYAFISRGGAVSSYFAVDQVAFALHKPDLDDETTPDRRTYVTFQKTFLDANPASNIRADQQLTGVSHYFLDDVTLTNVPHYRQLIYDEIYPGIDLIYQLTGGEGDLRYDYIVSSGADPAQIRFRVEGSRRLEITADGALLIHLPQDAILRQHAPYTYQDVGNQRVEVSSGFVLLDDQTIGFEVGTYDTSRPLIIDPTLVYSTYLGSGSSAETIPNMAVDAQGHAYLFGQSQGLGYPTTPGAYDETFEGYTDVFVTKLNQDGTGLIYSTFIGGISGEVADGITLDATGTVYVVGRTQSDDFPLTAGAYPANFPANIFLTKLNLAGNALLYSTRLGPGEPSGIAVDENGHAYITGNTTSAAFPVTVNAFQTNYTDGREAFLQQVDTNASGVAALVYSTFFGGGTAPTNIPHDQGTDIAVGGPGSVYITGETMSSDMPTTPNAYDTTLGGHRDAFIARFDTSQVGVASLLYSSYLGGSTGGFGNFFLGADYARSIAIDGNGNAYIIGETNAPDYPLSAGIVDPNLTDRSDGFVAGFNTNADGAASLIFSTYLGGSGSEYVIDVAITMVGLVITGSTVSTDFPVFNAIQPVNLGSDVFVTYIDLTGTQYLFSTFLGGSRGERGLSVAVDPDGFIYVTGFVQSADFPVTLGAYDTTLGRSDGFAVKIDAGITPMPTLTPTPTPTATPTATVTPTATAIGDPPSPTQSITPPVAAGTTPATNPRITKIGFVTEADQNIVEWIITVSNTGNGRVVIVDALDPRLELVRVEAPGGQVQVIDQTITVTFDSIPADQNRLIRVFTSGAQLTDVENTACVDGTDSCATGRVVRTLPQTGESRSN